MGFALWFTVLALAFDAALIAGVLIRRLCAVPASASITDIGPLLIAAGVLTALATFLFNIRRARSDDLLKAATELLEKAYEELAPNEGSDDPSNDRLSWLSAARLISTAERLSERITEGSHQLIYREKREYWRTRLHVLIFPTIEGLPASFYAESPEHMIGYTERARSPLSEKSLAFLYRFVRWPENVSDPIGQELNFTDEEIERMCTFGPRGLGNFLAEVRRLACLSQKQ
jgi:hypothetical protein